MKNNKKAGSIIAPLIIAILVMILLILTSCASVQEEAIKDTPQHNITTKEADSIQIKNCQSDKDCFENALRTCKLAEYSHCESGMCLKVSIVGKKIKNLIPYIQNDDISNECILRWREEVYGKIRYDMECYVQESYKLKEDNPPKICYEPSDLDSENSCENKIKRLIPQTFLFFMNSHSKPAWVLDSDDNNWKDGTEIGMSFAHDPSFHSVLQILYGSEAGQNVNLYYSDEYQQLIYEKNIIDNQGNILRTNTFYLIDMVFSPLDATAGTKGYGNSIRDTKVFELLDYKVKECDFE